jgi:hypothetical protein
MFVDFGSINGHHPRAESNRAYDRRTVRPSFRSRLLPSLGSCGCVGKHYRSQLAEALR